MTRALFLALVLLPLRLLAEAPQGYYRFPALHGETVVFTAEGDLWSVPVTGGLARRLTTHLGTESHAAISSDGQSIAFSAEYEGPTEVYTMPITGGLPARQTFTGSSSMVSGWSPDGRVLYATPSFSTLPNAQLASVDPRTGNGGALPLHQASEGGFDADNQTLFFTRLAFQGSSTKRYQGGTAQNLWRFTTGEAEARPLTADFKGTSKNPMWWHGRVYFLSDRDGVMNLWSMNPDGGDLHQLTHHKTYDVGSAALQGGRIVYQHAADLWLYDIARGTDTPIAITLATDFDQKRERWVKKPLEYLTAAHLSPNGDRVVLTARGQVFVAPAKQGRFVEATRQPGVRYRHARFLPDGKSLLALSDASGELEFCRIPANGVGQPEPLTRDGKIFRFAGLPSPDGKWLAWFDKNQQLWVFNLEQKQPKLAATSPIDEFSDLTWSPDSQWLAYVANATNEYRQIHLYRAADGTAATVTSDRVESYSPAWSPDGTWLYFLSDRSLRSLVPSPWGPRQPEPFFTEATKIYQVALVEGLRSPFRPRDELAPPEADKKKDDDKPNSGETKSAVSKHGEAKSGDTNKTPAVTVTIILAGLQERIEEVPVPAGNYSALAATAKQLLWVARDTGFDAKRHLKQLEITDDDPKPKTLAEDIRSYELSLDGKKLLLHKGEAFYVIAADAAAPAKLEDHCVKLDGWTFPLTPREEWRQIFVESWRMMRDYFYDRQMHGLDWPAVLQKYLPLVERISNREERGAGRIGYVHLRAMGAGNIAEWARDFYPVFRRQGLIIDVRHNRGGNIDSWILEKLLRKAWFYWQPRVGQPIWNMQYAFRGHVVVLCDEHTASDGEAFTEGFRRLGLGKVIGTRTWGGEIWLSAQRWLVDSGMATAAEMGVHGPEGVWLIEGHGVDPDLVVDNLPHATFEGGDAQLDAAVKHLQELIAKDPRPETPTPKYPDKLRK